MTPLSIDAEVTFFVFGIVMIMVVFSKGLNFTKDALINNPPMEFL